MRITVAIDYCGKASIGAVGRGNCTVVIDYGSYINRKLFSEWNKFNDTFENVTSEDVASHDTL